jgi:predicted phage terminase large subunit-like protein
MTDEIFIDPDLLAEATPDQQRRYADLLKRKRALATPLDYALYVNTKAKRHRHTEYMNEVLMALVEQRLYKTGPGPASVVVDITDQEPLGRRVHPETGEPALSQLMISLPPRIGKSWMVGEHFPAWFLTKFPDQQVMYISHGEGLAKALSGLARDHIDEHPELGVVLHDKHKAEGEWSLSGQNPMTSGMIAKGSDGVPTGRGGNLIIDDIFQKGEDVVNDNTRTKVHEHYESSLRPRVNPGNWKILMGTRWHENDLHGHLLDKEADTWFVINIPAVSFETVDDEGFSVDPDTGERDVFARLPNEAVCPEIAPLSYYVDAQTSNPFWYEAEYLGKPSGIGGNIFKDFQHYKRHVTEDGDSYYELFLNSGSEIISESDCVRFITADTALTDKQTSDWTVIGIWDLGPMPERRLILREVIRERITGDLLDDRLRLEFKKWGARVIGIEEATVSYKMIQDMIAEGGINVWPLKADKNKTVRAIPASNLLKQKRLIVDRDATWRTKYESELKQFDKGAHDDQVDMTSYAAVMRDLLRANPLPPTTDTLNKLRSFEAMLAELADADDPKEKPSRVVIGG